MLVQDGRAELLASIIKITDEKLAVANQMTIAHTACALVCSIVFYKCIFEV